MPIIQVGELEITCLSTPCHTSGHVCYVVTGNEEETNFNFIFFFVLFVKFTLDGKEQAVFTGDTLFIGGCGRFFEGTAAQMQSSLQKLASLNPQTVNRI